MIYMAIILLLVGFLSLGIKLASELDSLFQPPGAGDYSVDDPEVESGLKVTGAFAWLCIVAGFALFLSTAHHSL